MKIVKEIFDYIIRILTLFLVGLSITFGVCMGAYLFYIYIILR